MVVIDVVKDAFYFRPYHADSTTLTHRIINGYRIKLQLWDTAGQER